MLVCVRIYLTKTFRHDVSERRAENASELFLERPDCWPSVRRLTLKSLQVPVRIWGNWTHGLLAWPNSYLLTWSDALVQKACESRGNRESSGRNSPGQKHMMSLFSDRKRHSFGSTWFFMLEQLPILLKSKSWKREPSYVVASMAVYRRYIRAMAPSFRFWVMFCS